MKRVTLAEFRWAFFEYEPEIDLLIKWQKDHFPYILPGIHTDKDDLSDIEKVEWFLGQLLEYKRLSATLEEDTIDNLYKKSRLIDFIDRAFVLIRKDLIDCGD